MAESRVYNSNSNNNKTDSTVQTRVHFIGAALFFFWGGGGILSPHARKAFLLGKTVFAADPAKCVSRGFFPAYFNVRIANFALRGPEMRPGTGD